MNDMHTDQKTMTFSKEALRVIDDMNYHVNNIGAWYGTDHPKTIRAANSLRHSLTQMIQLGGNISKDGELSLYGISFIHYGVVFHGDKNAGKVLREDLYDQYPDYFPGDLKEMHLTGVPETGEWSVHS